MYRVPLSMIQDLEYSGVRANIEQQDTNFAKHTVTPHAVCAEQEFCRKLLITPQEKAELSIDFDLDALMRGDSAARAEYYNKGIMAGWLNRSTAAEKEKISLTEEQYAVLDPYLVPVNMIDATALQEVTPDTTSTVNSEDERGSIPAALLRTLSDKTSKLLEREAAGLKRIAEAQTSVEDFVTRAGKLLDQQQAHITDKIGPALELYDELAGVPHGTLARTVKRYRADFLTLKHFDPDSVAAFSEARTFSVIEA